MGDGYLQRESRQKSRRRAEDRELLALALALAPLALIIYLGGQGRPISDDFCHLVSGQEYGPWGNVLFWRDSLNGSYSYYFMHGLAAPLDIGAPGAFVIIIIAALLFGFVWLLDAGRRLASREGPPLAQAITLAAALVAFSIDALLSPLPIYHYSAAARHTLPISILLIVLAAGCEAILRIQTWRGLAIAGACLALLAFVNAGMAESFAILQLALLASLLPCAYTMLRAKARRYSIALILSGCAATVLALAVMSTAPGVARRLASFGDKYDLSPRSAAELLPEIFNHMQSIVFNAQLSAAFIGMLALSLFLSLSVRRPAPTRPNPLSWRLGAPLLLLCVLAVSALALVSAHELTFGKLRHYSLPFLSFAFAFSGTICGTALASAINQAKAASPATKSVRAIMVGSAIVAVAIWSGLMQRNAQRVPSFEEFSRAWDERHQLILAKRDGGERLESLPRLNADHEKLSGYFTGGREDYWKASCASEEITALLERKYRA